MNNYSVTDISKVAIHNVGNKVNDDGIFLSKKAAVFESSLKSILISYFVSPFKSNEYFNLYHNSDLNLNEVYVYASKIFDKPNTLYDQSVHLAKHLYECSTHPKIKGGEFYTVYFKECEFEGQTVEAIGLFKSESKDTFLKVKPTEEFYEIESDSGININKLEKGCLIFNIERENGFVVEVVDNASRGEEAIYWVDNFLQLSQRQDNYHNTKNILTLYKKFITKELPQEFEVSKADQADFLNKSIQFFKEKDSFDLKEFTHEVIEQPDLIKRFNKFKNDYQKETDIIIDNNFTISESAFKKQARVFKSVLKLDKNFHIYIHGNRELIEQGVEKDGRKFYKIYYNEEN
ncbi:MAG: nucleoid-associated protein [Candidatus Kapabacteria bacterium]|nr:nucleoid-associated protein [Candidatus Kapabacteria bacterium]